MQLVDAHHHFLDPNQYHYPWMSSEMDYIRRAFGPSDLRPVVEANGVAQTVVVQTLHNTQETLGLLAEAERTDFVAGVVGWVDLTASDVTAQVSRLQEAPGGNYLVGIRHLVHEEPDPNWLLRDDVRRGLEAIARAGLTFDLLVRTRELPAATLVAKSLPELRLVVDHLAKPRVRTGGDEVWAVAIAAIGACDNVYCKISGLATETGWHDWTVSEFVPVVEHAIEVFGFARLLFGSDWPVCLLAATYEQVMSLTEYSLQDASSDERHSFYAANARQFYGLRALL